MSDLELHERVRVTTDRFADAGAARGTLGYVVEVFGDGTFEVEVSKAATGETIAMLTASREDLESDER